MKTKLWQHMADTHGLNLTESEESDIRWAASEDAEQARVRLVNEITKLAADESRINWLETRERDDLHFYISTHGMRWRFGDQYDNSKPWHTTLRGAIDEGRGFKS